MAPNALKKPAVAPPPLLRLPAGIIRRMAQIQFANYPKATVKMASCCRDMSAIRDLPISLRARCFAQTDTSLWSTFGASARFRFSDVTLVLSRGDFADLPLPSDSAFLYKLDLSACTSLTGSDSFDPDPIPQPTPTPTVGLATLRGAPNLVVLSMPWCKSLIDLGPVSHCKALETVDLVQCDAVVDLTPLSRCTMLRTIDLSWCKGVIDLAPLAACSQLSWINLSHTSVRDLEPLRPCSALAECIVIGCSAINAAKVDQFVEEHRKYQLMHQEELGLAVRVVTAHSKDSGSEYEDYDEDD